MSVKVLIDMNLSPAWVQVFARNGWSAVHWSTIGNPGAADRIVMDFAVAHGYVVFTHDLDFGTMLALTHAIGPSVLQVRAEDILPGQLERLVIAALVQHDSDLASGALVVIDGARRRVRVLPI